MARKNVKDNYCSIKESKQISKSNKKIIAKVEKRREHVSNTSNYITKMRDINNVVEFNDVHTYFFTDAGIVKAVNGVSIDIPIGKAVCIVGESGCGKSVTSLTLMQLVQRHTGQTVAGEIRFNDGNRVIDIIATPKKIIEELRGNQMSMIFQEPMTSLNPVFRIGKQIEEVFLLHKRELSREERKARCLELLQMVGIANAENVYKMYPHELSGGMRQRVMIAIAIACNPRLIIADEPTTALDVTIQAQILDLLKSIKDKTGCSIMLITHDLGVICEMADLVVVMYAGRVVEKGTVTEIFTNPCHPYTIGLLQSKPSIDSKTDRLYCIPGNVPNPINMPQYCYFRDRCKYQTEKCAEKYPSFRKISDTHYVSCYRGFDVLEGNNG